MSMFYGFSFVEQDFAGRKLNQLHDSRYPSKVAFVQVRKERVFPQGVNN